jgi:hypothetical protein
LSGPGIEGLNLTDRVNSMPRCPLDSQYRQGIMEQVYGYEADRESESDMSKRLTVISDW